MRIFTTVSGLVKVFIFTIVSAGFIGAVTPIPAYADGQFKTETKAKPRKAKLTPQQKKHALKRLKFDLDSIETDQFYARKHSEEAKRKIGNAQFEIEKEHKAQIKAGKLRRALDKKRAKIVKDLQRNSKKLTLAQKDKMVRQANKLQGDIAKVDKAVADSKHRVKKLRKVKSDAVTQKSKQDAKLLKLAREHKTLEGEINKLR